MSVTSTNLISDKCKRSKGMDLIILIFYDDGVFQAHGAWSGLVVVHLLAHQAVAHFNLDSLRPGPFKIEGQAEFVADG